MMWRDQEWSFFWEYREYREKKSEGGKSKISIFWIKEGKYDVDDA